MEWLQGRDDSEHVNTAGGSAADIMGRVALIPLRTSSRQSRTVAQLAQDERAAYNRWRVMKRTGDDSVLVYDIDRYESFSSALLAPRNAYAVQEVSIVDVLEHGIFLGEKDVNDGMQIGQENCQKKGNLRGLRAENSRSFAIFMV